MSSLAKISRTPDGKFKTEFLTPIDSVRVVARFPQPSVAEFFFYDQINQQKFYVFTLQGPTPVEIGLLGNEAWLNWSWCWESIAEAESASRQVPEAINRAIELLLSSIQAFIQSSMARHEQSGGQEFSISVDEILQQIGWEIYIMDISVHDQQCRLNIYKKLRSAKKG
jgi:hypothetical protein